MSAFVDYLRDAEKYATEKPYILAFDIEIEKEEQRTNLEYERKTIQTYDLRNSSNIPLIESDGFELLPISGNDMARYFSASSSEQELLGVAKLLRERFSTEFVFCYDHAYRKEEDREVEAQYTNENPPQRSIIVRNPHADQTWESGHKRLKKHFTETEYKKFKSPEWRCRIINIWKPLSSVIQRAPLLLCDGTTIRKEQMVPCDIVSAKYVGESAFLRYDATHRWYMFSNQQPNEAIIFQSFDTTGDGDAKACFHTSCEPLDTIDRGLSPRESVEVRAIVVTSNKAITD